MMVCKTFASLLFLVFAGLLLPTVESAAQERGQWLAGTAGLHSVIQPSPDLTYANMFSRFRANRLKGADGDLVPVSGSANLYADQKLYVAKHKITGANFGVAGHFTFANASTGGPLSAQPAAQTGGSGAPRNATAAADDSQLGLTPYLWFAGLHGTVGALGRTVSVHASPGDVLSHFDIGLMAAAEFSHKRLLLPVDLLWIRLSDSHALPFPVLSAVSADARVGEFVLTPKIGYRVLDQEKFKIDALTGFRYWHLGEKLQFNPSVLGLNFSGSQNWVDPLVGGRIQTPLSPKLEVTIAGDVGGWGAGSQLDYQVVGLLGYKIKPKLTLQLGYRYLDVDFRSGGSIYDTTTAGALLGLTINLK